MSYTPMSDLGQQGLFDITRTLLQQPDLPSLSEALSQLVKRSALADCAAIVLWQAQTQRARYFATRENGKPIDYEDETVLAHGPVRRILSRPDALHCNYHEFTETWPQLASGGLYSEFGHYCLLPLAADGRIFGGCEFIRNEDRPWSEKEYNRLQTFTQIVGVVAEQIQSRVSNNVDYDLLCRERDNFRILVAITNAVLSRLDIDELVSEVAKEIHHYFDIDAISIVLRSDRKNKLSIYSTHYLDEHHPAHEQSEVDEAGTLSERVFKSKEMLLINLSERDILAPYERMLFETWGNQLQTLCLLPLMSGNTMLGVLKLAQCEEKVFTTANLKLLRQIAERVAIAVDNALAYQEIHRLKERLVDENLALTEQLNNVESEFGEIIGRSEAMYSVLKQVEMVAQSDSTVLILGVEGSLSNTVVFPPCLLSLYISFNTNLGINSSSNIICVAHNAFSSSRIFSFSLCFSFSGISLSSIFSFGSVFFNSFSSIFYFGSNFFCCILCSLGAACCYKYKRKCECYK